MPTRMAAKFIIINCSEVGEIPKGPAVANENIFTLKSSAISNLIENRIIY